MNEENIYTKMTEREAMDDCKEKIFDVVHDLMNAHGKSCGKEVLEDVLDGLCDNGYFL